MFNSNSKNKMEEERDSLSSQLRKENKMCKSIEKGMGKFDEQLLKDTIVKDPKGSILNLGRSKKIKAVFGLSVVPDTKEI